LIRKACFEQTGYFDEKLPGCQDWDMWLRIANKFEFRYVNKLLARYYMHGKQMSADMNARINARTMFLEKHREIYRENPGAYVDLTNSLGLLCLLARDNSAARRTFISSIKQKPLQKHGYWHLLLSTMMPGLYRKALTLYRLKKEGDIVFY